MTRTDNRQQIVQMLVKLYHELRLVENIHYNQKSYYFYFEWIKARIEIEGNEGNKIGKIATQRSIIVRTRISKMYMKYRQMYMILKREKWFKNGRNIAATKT